MPVSIRKKSRRRHFLHHPCGLLNISLAPLLIAQISLAWLVHSNATFTLPMFGEEYIQSKLAEAGINVNFHALHVRLDGHVEIDYLEIGQPNARDPIFTARKAIIDFSLFDLLQQKIELRHIFVDDAAFYVPAIFSNDGMRQTVLQDIRAELKREGEWLMVDTLQAHYGHMPVVAYGNMILPNTIATQSTQAAETTPAKKLITEADWKTVMRLAGSMLHFREELEQYGTPSLEVSSHGESTGAVNLSVQAHGDVFALPQNAKAYGASLEFSVKFDGANFHPGRDAALIVSNVEWNDPEKKIIVKTGPMRLETHVGLNWEKPKSGKITVADVSINEALVDFASGAVDWSAFPKIFANGIVVVGEDFVKAKVEGNWETEALTADFQARLTPEIYLHTPAIAHLLPKEILSLRIPSRSDIDGTIDFAEGLKLIGTKFHFQTGAAEFKGFHILYGSGDVELTPSKISLTNASLVAENYSAQGSFYTGFTATDDFRILLQGSTQPELLNPFLPDWWSMIWESVKVNPAFGKADVDVHGNWNWEPDGFVYCTVVAHDGMVRGEKIDNAELRVIANAELIALFDMFGRQGENAATGTLQWHYTRPDFKEESLRFQFEGNFPKSTAMALAGIGMPELPEYIEPLKIAQSAHAKVVGYLHGEASQTPNRRQITVTGNTTGAITAWNFPLSHFDGTIAYDDNQLAITIDKARIANGTISSSFNPVERSKEASKKKQVPSREKPSYLWIDLRPEHPVMQLDVELLNARQTQLLDALEKLSPDYQPAPQATTSPPPDYSETDLRFVGTLTLPDPTTLRGHGHLFFRDPNIAHLHLFGGLSSVLDKMGLGITSFKLESADCELLAQDNKIYVPNGILQGADSFVKIAGYYDNADESLHFRAMLTVTTGGGIPLLGNVIDIMNKLPHLTPVDVSGTTKDPKWKIDPTPSALIKSPWDPSIGQPPKSKPPVPTTPAE